MEVTKQAVTESSTPPRTGKSVTFSEPVSGRRTGMRRRERYPLPGESTAHSDTNNATPPMVRPSILKAASPLTKPSHAEVCTRPVPKTDPEITKTAALKTEKTTRDFQTKPLPRLRQFPFSENKAGNELRLNNEKAPVMRRSLPSCDDNKTNMASTLAENQKSLFGKGGNVGSSRTEAGKDKPQQSVSPVRQGLDLSFVEELKNKHKFSVAFEHQNQVATTAIKSLDSLNDQIVQYIFGTAAAAAADTHGHNPAPTPTPTTTTTNTNNNNNPPFPLLPPLLPPPQPGPQPRLSQPAALDPPAQGHPPGPGQGQGRERGQGQGQGHGQGQGQGHGHGALTGKEQEGLQTSMVLIRRLLQDAQGKFRKMVEENKQLAVRIDTSLQSANQEVHALRTELADTNKRLSQINCKAADDSLNTSLDSSLNISLTSSTFNTLSSAVDNSTTANTIGNNNNNQLHLIQKLREENSRLETQVRLLSQEVTSLRGGGDGHGGVKDGVQQSPGPPPPPHHRPPPSPSSSSSSSGPSYGELKLELIQARQELNRAKEALQAMKSDRKRLKTEKVELLHQMKQLYVTLEDKESELRDFIRNYEQRVQESDESIKQLAMEKEEAEREKWEIIKKARESAERAVMLRTQLDTRDITVTELQDQLTKLKEQLAERGLDDSRESDNATPTPTAQDNGHVEEPSTPSTPATSLRSSSSSTPLTTCPNHHHLHHHHQQQQPTPPSGTRKTSTPVGSGVDSATATPGGSSVVAESGGSESGSCHTPEGYLSKEDSCSGGTPMSTPSYTERGNDSLSSLMKWMTLSTEAVEAEGKNAKKKKKSSFGSLSRVFGRNRSRRSIALPHSENMLEDTSGTKLCLLTPENYQEKLQTLEGLGGVAMGQWRAGQVLAWLEVALGMPMYGRNCALNIKSGKILLGLSDSELGAALGITNHIHKRKLRLAIEEHRDPTNIKFPQASKLDVTWVAHKLLPDLGLPQYSHVFEVNLVDGRLLHSLSRRDLEKHFDIHRKFHQASILHAVELLRRLEFDREKLAERRGQCEDSDSDLIVWTCSRLVAWIRSIDLGEFAEHLQESGVHGAMMVLEPSFNADTLATALAIPPSKAYIRRHLATELDTLLRPARSYQTGLKILRAALDTPNNNSKHLDPGGKGHTFTRSYRGHSGEDGTKGRLSFRGSLGRAFGKKIRDDLKLAFDSDSPKWKISAPIPIQHTPSPLLQSHKPHLPRSSSDKVVEIPGDSTAV